MSNVTIPAGQVASIGDRVAILYGGSKRWAELETISDKGLTLAWNGRTIKNVAPDQILAVEKPSCSLLDNLRTTIGKATGMTTSVAEATEALGDVLEDFADLGWAQFATKGVGYVIGKDPLHALCGDTSREDGGAPSTRVYYDAELQAYWRRLQSA